MLHSRCVTKVGKSPPVHSEGVIALRYVEFATSDKLAKQLVLVSVGRTNRVADGGLHGGEVAAAKAFQHIDDGSLYGCCCIVLAFRIVHKIDRRLELVAEMLIVVAPGELHDPAAAIAEPVAR